MDRHEKRREVFRMEDRFPPILRWDWELLDISNISHLEKQIS